MKSYAVIGDWNIICEVCRKKTKASQIRKRWDGLLVCEDDYEERHPLDYPRPPYYDDKPLPFTKPESEDRFTLTCSVKGQSGVTGYAIAGCAITGGNPPPYGIFNDGIPAGNFNNGL